MKRLNILLNEYDKDHQAWRNHFSRPLLLIVIAVVIVACICISHQIHIHNHTMGEHGAIWEPVGFLPELAKAQVECDYFIYGATVVDGLGRDPYVADIAIKDDIIIMIGIFLPTPGAQVIDASGMLACPGFIDIHTHTDDYWQAQGDGAPALMQGVTTQIVGNCGDAPADISVYLKQVDQGAINIGVFVGYKVLRENNLKNTEAVTASDIAAMQQQLAQGIQEGAMGLSLGLSYYPQNQITYEELLALAKTTKKFDGLMAIHIRDEGDNLVASVREALQVAEESKVAMQYNHIKAAGPDNWHKQEQVLELFNQAIARGVDVQGDAYVYTYSSNDLTGLNESISVDNIKKVILDRNVMLASDGGLVADGTAIHPRAYANTTEFLISYVREQQFLKISEAVRKMTSMPAERLQLVDRGSLQVGKKADLVIFNLDELRTNATRHNPSRLSAGMSYVFVNGTLAVEKGNLTGLKGGKALYKEN